MFPCQEREILEVYFSIIFLINDISRVTTPVNIELENNYEIGFEKIEK